MIIVDKFNKKKKPKKIDILVKNIPKELKKNETWVCWFWYWDGNKWSKPPCKATSKGTFKFSHLESKYTFDECFEAYQNNPDIAGIGTSLRKEDKYCGIDFDDVLSKKGKPNKRLKKALKILNGAYIEQSPGGLGVRVFGIGKPKNRPSSKSSREIEIYKDKRYLTVTGHSITDSKSLTNIEKACKKIDKKIYKKEKSLSKPGKNTTVDHENSDPKIKSIRKYLNTETLDPDDRPTWIKVGMIIHHEMGGSMAGYQLWNGWSQLSSAGNYNEEDSLSKWMGFKKKKKSDNPITFASLIYEAKEKEKADSNFVLITHKEIEKDKTPPPENILDPWFMKGSINMVHAKRGLGKTHFSIGLSLALASGGTFLKWKAKEPKRVLYIDGEMPFALLKEFIDIQKTAMKGKPPKANMLNFITIDKQKDGIFPSLSEEKGQLMVEEAIRQCKAEVLIVDSLFTCFKINEYAGDYWSDVQDWLIKLRGEGIDILLVHHDNKSGKAQSGRVDKEHASNAIIHLKEPSGMKKGKAARFEIEFSKARHFYGANAKNFEARLTPNKEGGSDWEVLSSEMTTRERIIEYVKDGNNLNEIAIALNISKPCVSQHVKRAMEDDLIHETDCKWSNRRTRQPSRTRKRKNKGDKE
jgi:AAA domain/Primase C terminal 2 (PriCT-2)